MGETWQEVAARRAGVLGERDLQAAGVSRAFVRNQLEAQRWSERTHSVLTTTTGPLSREQLLWVAVTHAGPGALVGGLTAAGLLGLRGWDRDTVTVLVEHELSFDPIDGVRFIRTRRDLAAMRHPGLSLPTCRIEPAVLLFAATEPHLRTAMGSLAAVVQQRLTSPRNLAAWARELRPLRRAAHVRALLADLEGGSQSMAEVDAVRRFRARRLVPPARQRKRTDRSGRPRFTDLEWDLPDGRVLVLEVDGAFHLDVLAYGADVKRQRGLTTPTRTVIRCTALELRHDPDDLVADLLALGVPRLPSSGAQAVARAAS